MRSYTLLAAVVAPLVHAVPAPKPAPVAAPAPAPLPMPQVVVTNPITGLLGSLLQGSLSLGSLSSAVPAVISDTAQLVDSTVPVLEAIANGTLLGTDTPAVVQKLFQAVQPTSTPTSIQDAMTKAAGAFGVSNANSAPAPEQNILENVLTLVLEGFTSSDIQAVLSGASPFTNTATNVNRPVPLLKTFYNTVFGNAPFSVPEAQLRAAMYIPPGFTWRKKQPVLMSPGTGATGSVNFQSNIGKLLAQENFADPVYLNIPNALLSDAQINAEYVAYALQYLYALTSKKPAIVTWSQGSLDAQWAFKYWPSVPKIVTDHIAISPDYHGTVLAYILCPGFALGNSIACVPSVIQQEYNSQFVTKLRSNGGDSAYVPTTTVYSLLDEIVQPQVGTAASGFLNDARNIGVSNTFLQGACLGQPAGGVYLHEGVL
ncbi:related to lipase B precursor [Phialocephala subalpina]|uniref:Related to lipase B n=1 Tax=Phialocephala subalpina TaxID=576137 RepID=A0A1L7XIK5_9HELO|nr:related to lipase B precursor [Phialocephala subalpina]